LCFSRGDDYLRKTALTELATMLPSALIVGGNLVARVAEKVPRSTWNEFAMRSRGG
jgi:hypothetical protein